VTEPTWIVFWVGGRGHRKSPESRKEPRKALLQGFKKLGGTIHLQKGGDNVSASTAVLPTTTTKKKKTVEIDKTREKI